MEKTEMLQTLITEVKKQIKDKKILSLYEQMYDNYTDYEEFRNTKIPLEFLIATDLYTCQVLSKASFSKDIWEKIIVANQKKQVFEGRFFIEAVSKDNSLALAKGVY